MTWFLLLLAPALAQVPDERPHVVLLSMDTTRADALSCYQAIVGPQRTPPTSPRLDQLAADGARFEHFYANAPSTLSSHATMFTGLDPHGHGVVRNGFPVPAELPTLPERLQAEGWDTIAILAAAALEAEMGLDRGFRVYDDHAPVLRGLMYQDTASNVVRRALARVDERPDPAQPLFLFVHFYDPHTPYVPPPSIASMHVDPTYDGSATGHGDAFKEVARQARQGLGDPRDLAHVNELYLAEVAYMDQQIGRLLDGLESRGILGDALVIALADHGETLTDDPSYVWSHGSNLGHEVIWVPLIVWGPTLGLAQGAVVERQAAMTGLAATIERAVGLSPTLGRHDFYDLVRAGPAWDTDGWPERPTLPVYAEATRPRMAEARNGWNNRWMHRAVWAGGWGAWMAPFAREPLQFYARGRLPHEGARTTLRTLLQAWDERMPPHRDADMPDHTRRALRALGYVED